MSCEFSYGRRGRRGGSPVREKRKKIGVVKERRQFRRELARLCRRWHNAWPGQRIRPKIINKLKEEAARLALSV